MQMRMRMQMVWSGGDADAASLPKVCRSGLFVDDGQVTWTWT